MTNMGVWQISTPLVDQVFMNFITADLYPSWVALPGMAHSITELCKPLHQGSRGINETNSIIKML